MEAEKRGADSLIGYNVDKAIEINYRANSFLEISTTLEGARGWAYSHNVSLETQEGPR